MKKILVSDIRYACGDTSYVRGRNYFEKGRVRNPKITLEESYFVHLQAETLGSGNNYYRQEIDIDWQPGYSSVGIDGFCSCPMAHNCKHIAAVCIAFKENAISREIRRVPPDCLSWLDTLSEPSIDVDYSKEFFAYVIEPSMDELEPVLTLYKTREKKTGGFTVGKKISVTDIRYSFSYSHSVEGIDKEIIKILAGETMIDFRNELTLTGGTGYLIIRKALQSGRLFWQSHQTPPLKAGPGKDLQFVWEQDDLGDYKLNLSIAAPDTVLIMTEPPVYIDHEAGTVGVINLHDLSVYQFRQLLAAPTVSADKVEEFSYRLISEYPEISLPAPINIDVNEINGCLPVPRLLLFGDQLDVDHYSHFIKVRFDYAGKTISAVNDKPIIIAKTEQGFFKIHRDMDAESKAITELDSFGFSSMGSERMNDLILFSPVGRSRLDSASRWSDFIDHKVPELEKQGWIVETDESFKLTFQSVQNWDAEIEQTDNDWFQMRFNVVINGTQMPLLPLIMPVLEEYDPEQLPEMLSVPINRHSYVNIPSAQLIPFLDILFELFDNVTFDKDGYSKISRFNAASLADFEEHSYGLFSINGAAELLETGRKLKSFEGITDCSLPSGLKAELRSYQKKGLNWLQFLREYHFAGILADDMGLGKTVQTLAHLLLEKESGRLNKPCLVIAPTSLMSNWRREAERFTPDLNVLVLQGAGRKQRFDLIDQHDLILTTYPLLPRDEEVLLDREYYFLILDEAQVIKNPKSQAARIVRNVKTEHRLCITGTPMENHLGELWAQFDFLMPGFLGDSLQFKRLYRTPIEVHGDAQKRQRLSKRLEPFLLRRGKQEVADELPEKSEIIRSVPLYEQQAALYESIRISMEKKVRDAIAEKGLARSHIMILDALLKLRQTCCDPRTLSLKHAQKVTESAKLDLLMSMLPELLEEGRRILVFSQFTRMLSLIETELKSVKIDYVKLTGQTRKRDEAIEKFKNGAADVFLISLKAGGVGLNLTEADTVIIYDPWWNPAVESQAADRAHRIGQDKAVFVYKLITEDTVEEKILALQEKKRALAESVYQEGKNKGAFQLSSEELTALFKPID